MALWVSDLRFFTWNVTEYAQLTCPSDWQMMPFTLLSDFEAFRCKPTEVLSFERSHILRSVSSLLSFSQIHSIIVHALLSTLIRPKLVGALQGQVGPWLLFYHVNMLRPCLCLTFFYAYFPFLQILLYFLFSYIFIYHYKFISGGWDIIKKENSIAQNQKVPDFCFLIYKLTSHSSKYSTLF